jgi:hypothetical protein
MMLALFANWRGLAAGAVALVIALALLYAKHEHGRAEGLKTQRDAALAAAKVEHAQGSLNQSAGEAATKAETRAVQITVKAAEAAHVVQSAPGASEALPVAVRDAWRAGIVGLRDGEADPASAPDDPPRGQPSPPMPPS